LKKRNMKLAFNKMVILSPTPKETPMEIANLLKRSWFLISYVIVNLKMLDEKLILTYSMVLNRVLQQHFSAKVSAAA